MCCNSFNEIIKIKALYLNETTKLNYNNEIACQQGMQQPTYNEFYLFRYVSYNSCDSGQCSTNY